MSATTEYPMSEKQFSFINSLLKQKDVPAASQKQIDLSFADGAPISSKDASDLITYLKGLKNRGGITEHGVYQTPDGTIYVAQWNKSKTNLYAKKLTETGERMTEAGVVVDFDYEYAAGAVFKLTPAMKMGFEQAKALTIKYGRCMVCSKRLKNPKSVEQGIGPVCAKSFA